MSRSIARHPSFVNRIDETAAQRHLKVSLVVVGLLSMAVGLCTSAVIPQPGWLSKVPAIFL